MSRLRFLIAAAASPVLLAAPLAAGGVTTVAQQGRAFSLRDVQVVLGDTLRITNDDDYIHQLYVHASAMSFDSGEQDPGRAVTIPFPTAGTFQVRCQIHPRMLLNVMVR